MLEFFVFSPIPDRITESDSACNAVLMDVKQFSINIDYYVLLKVTDMPLFIKTALVKMNFLLYRSATFFTNFNRDAAGSSC